MFLLSKLREIINSVQQQCSQTEELSSSLEKDHESEWSFTHLSGFNQYVYYFKHCDNADGNKRCDIVAELIRVLVILSLQLKCNMGVVVNIDFYVHFLLFYDF